MGKSIAAKGAVILVIVIVAMFVWSWISRPIPPIAEVGSYGDPKVMSQMMNKFAEGTYTVLATIPTNKQFSSDSSVKFIIGVKKSSMVEDGKRFFQLCIGEVGEEGCMRAGPTPLRIQGDGSGLMFAFQPVILLDKRGDTDTVGASMQIPAGTVPGIYGYAIYACAKTSADDACIGASDPDYYGMYEFNVTVE
jgi:hypothetical protein